MTRFFALSLMVATAAVLAGFVVPGAPPSELPIASLGLPLLVIGVLFGLLASERHWVWALVAAGIVMAMLWNSPAPAVPPPAKGSPVASGQGPVPDRPEKPVSPVLLLSLPPVSLLAGSLLGSILIRRRQQKFTEPEASD